MPRERQLLLEALQRHGASSPGGELAAALRGPGGAHARGGGAGLRGPGAELPRAERASQPAGPPPDRPGGGAGGAGGHLPGAVGRAGLGALGHPQGGRRLFAAGPGLSRGAAGLHAGRCRPGPGARHRRRCAAVCRQRPRCWLWMRPRPGPLSAGPRRTTRPTGSGCPLSFPSTRPTSSIPPAPPARPRAWL